MDHLRDAALCIVITDGLVREGKGGGGWGWWGAGVRGLHLRLDGGDHYFHLATRVSLPVQSEISHRAIRPGVTRPLSSLGFMAARSRRQAAYRYR